MPDTVANAMRGNLNTYKGVFSDNDRRVIQCRVVFGV